MNIYEHPNFKTACLKVANDRRNLAYSILSDNEYAAHVTQETKEKDLQRTLAHADRVEKGEIPDFTTWQLVNYELTGECVAFLPK